MIISTYRGFTIDVTEDGTFVAKDEELDFRRKTLSDLQEALDKHISASVKRERLALPIVAIFKQVKPHRRGTVAQQEEGEELEEVRGLLMVGVHRSTRNIQTEPPLKEHQGLRLIMADTPANRKRLATVMETERAYRAATSDAGAHEIKGLGYGRVEATEYPELLRAVEKKHAASAAEVDGSKQ
jgi:hypothetical protein